MDPYSGRYFPREVRAERLADTIRMEKGVESVVRARTWGVVKERCEALEGDEAWEEAFERWRRASKVDEVGGGGAGEDRQMDRRQ